MFYYILYMKMQKKLNIIYNFIFYRVNILVENRLWKLQRKYCMLYMKLMNMDIINNQMEYIINNQKQEIHHMIFYNMYIYMDQMNIIDNLDQYMVDNKQVKLKHNQKNNLYIINYYHNINNMLIRDNKNINYLYPIHNLTYMNHIDLLYHYLDHLYMIHNMIYMRYLYFILSMSILLILICTGLWTICTLFCQLFYRMKYIFTRN